MSFQLPVPNVSLWKGQGAGLGSKRPGVVWLLFPVSFSYCSQDSDANPALLAWVGPAGAQIKLGKTAQGAGDLPVKAPGKVCVGTRSGV